MSTLKPSVSFGHPRSYFHFLSSLPFLDKRDLFKIFPTMLRLNLTFDSFGGRTKVFDFLFERKLLNKTCPSCGQERPIYFETGKTIPRFRCGPCKVRMYCTKNTAIEWNMVRDIPLFIFVAHCFCECVSTKAIMALTGADYRTIQSYITTFREALCAAVKEKRRSGELMLGGPGKVVEVDEMFLSHRKYKRGRKLEKEGTWVLGLTEVDASSHPIENPEALEKLIDREDKREQAARERAERRKTAMQHAIRMRLHDFPSAFSTQSTSQPPRISQRDSQEPQCRDVDLDRRAMENDDPVDLVKVGNNADDCEGALERIEFENQLRRLFSQSRKDKEKKTIFFVLPDRRKETLEKIIKANVKPNSVIFTDEWRGYNGLEAIGFQHKTICHQRRYSRFEFQGNIATRVTTNHIERMWVELRKTLKFMNMELVVRYIGLETYRQMSMFSLSHDVNMENMLRDLAKYGTSQYGDWFERD